MDKEKEQGDVDSKLKLIKFPEPEENSIDIPTMYEVNIVFSKGKQLSIFCSGFAQMENLGKDMIGFYSGDASSVETILNASNIDYMDIVEVEI